MSVIDYSVAAAGAALILFILIFFLGGSRKQPQSGHEHHHAALNKAELLLGGLHCPSCLLAIERKWKRTDGVAEISSNFDTGRTTISNDPGLENVDQLIEQVENLGYSATPVTEHTPETSTEETEDEVGYVRSRLIVSVILTIPIVVIAMGIHAVPPSPLIWIELVLTAIVLFWGGWRILRSACGAVKNRASDMNV